MKPRCWPLLCVILRSRKTRFPISLLLLGTQVYILNGTDPEGDPVRYGLTFEKGSKEYFRVDSKSGNVTLIQELDREVSLRWVFCFEESWCKCVASISQSDVYLLFVETR